MSWLLLIGLLATVGTVAFEVWFRVFRRCKICGGHMRLSRIEEPASDSRNPVQEYVPWYQRLHYDTEVYRCHRCTNTDSRKIWG